GARKRRAEALRRGPRARDAHGPRGAARREPSRLARAGEGGPGAGAPGRRRLRRARARPGARRARPRAPAGDRPASALLGCHRAGDRRGSREEGSRAFVRRVAYRLFRSTSTFQYRLGRQLTPAGKFALAALVAAAVIGFDTNRTVGYQVFTLLAALLSVSTAWSGGFRVRLDVRRVLPRFVTAGEPAAPAARAPAGRRGRGGYRTPAAAPGPPRVHRRHDRAARSARPRQRARSGPAPRLARGAAEALRDAGPGTAGGAEVPAWRHRSHLVRRRFGGIRVPARLPPRRPAAPHPLEERGAGRPAGGEGVPGRALRAPRAGPRHVCGASRGARPP